MKLVLVLVFSLILAVSCDDDKNETEEVKIEEKPSSDEIKTEEDVIVVTKGNWDIVVTDDAKVLVEFYAPWCGHCKNFGPEFARAATKLKEENSDILLAKVDVTVEKELAEKHGVQDLPTIKFFKRGKIIEFGGGRTMEEVIYWLEKKGGQPAKAIETSEEMKSFVDAKEVSVVGFFSNQESELAVAFLQAADDFEDIEFAVTTPDASGEYNVKEDKIVVFKKFDELRADYPGEANVDAITNFVRIESFALVTEFTDITAPKIFSGDVKTHLLLFVSKTFDAFNETVEEFQTAAKTFKGDILFVYIDVDDDNNKQILEYFALKPTDCPTLRLVHLENDMAKYAPDKKEVNAETIIAFVRDFQDGKIQPHFMSEEVPEDWDKNPVKVLVGKSFKEIAIDSGKDVIVEFYAPWCEHCKQLFPIWDQLAEHYKDNDNIVIAKMDSTKNEVAEVMIKGFPTITFFGKGEIIEYKGGRKFEHYVKFIDSGGKDFEVLFDGVEEAETKKDGEAPPEVKVEEDNEESQVEDVGKDEL